jgi:hypothetical protein
MEAMLNSGPAALSMTILIGPTGSNIISSRNPSMLDRLLLVTQIQMDQLF